MGKRILKIVLALLTVFACLRCSAGREKQSSDGKPQREKIVNEEKHSKKSTDLEKPSNSVSNEETHSLGEESTVNQPSEMAQESQTKEQSLKHVLDVSPQLQEVWYYCAPTTVSMILSARGIQIDQYTLAGEMGTYEPYGTHNRDAIRILNKHLFGYEEPASGQSGYRLATVTNVDQDLPIFQERLIKNIKDGYPMYYTIDAGQVYGGKPGDHNVIGIGYKWNDNRETIDYVYYLDPDPSPNIQDPIYGGLKILTPRELLEATIICGEPNYGW